MCIGAFLCLASVCFSPFFLGVSRRYTGLSFSAIIAMHPATPSPPGGHVVNLAFSLNRACNLRCRHCNLSNEFKKDTTFIEDARLEHFMEVGRRFLAKNVGHFSDINVLVTGGEITMLPKTDFRRIVQRIADFFAELRKTYPATSRIALATNLAVLSDEKRALLADLATDQQVNLEIATSYDLTTDRFRKPMIRKKWERNLQWLKSRGVHPTIFWTLCKGDVANFKQIADYLFSFGLPVTYLITLPFGEAKTNSDTIMPTYDDVQRFLINFYEYAYSRGLQHLLPRNTYYAFDKIINVIFEHKGYIFFDLFGQDEILQIEKHARPPSIFANEYFIVANGDPQSVADQLSRTYVRFNRDEQRYFAKVGCYSCRYFQDCGGGHRLSRKMFDTPDACAGYKGVFEYFEKHPLHA